MLEVYIYDKPGHRLFIDPFNNKFKDCQMLRTNNFNSILDICPHIITVNGERFRVSDFAVDFAFCSPCPWGIMPLVEQYYDNACRNVNIMIGVTDISDWFNKEECPSSRELTVYSSVCVITSLS